MPEKITIDGSTANEAAIMSYNEAHGTAITIRKIKYLNNMVEQDQRAVKRVTRPIEEMIQGQQAAIAWCEEHGLRYTET